MIELNSFLQPVNSPITNRPNVDGYDFDSQTERSVVRNAFIRDAAITNAKLGTAIIGTANIGTLTFNESSGGTATFGGTTNGNGLVEVLNDAGGTIVELNKAGIKVTNGSVVIENSSGDDAIDSLGVVSVQNFVDAAASLTAGGTQNITPDNTFVDLIGGSLSFVSTRSKVLFIDTMVQHFIKDNSGGTTNFSGNSVFEIVVGGTAQTPGGVIIEGGRERFGTADTFGNSHLSSNSFHAVTTVGAGTTTIKLQGKCEHTNGTPSLKIYGYKLSYVVLGT